MIFLSVFYKSSRFAFSPLLSLVSTKQAVAYMDIDLSADPNELSILCNHIHDNDVVIGSRIMRGRLPMVKRPLYRSLFSLAYFFRYLIRIPNYDPKCGFKIFRREVIIPLLVK
jgi:hypothetical protein